MLMTVDNVTRCRYYVFNIWPFTTIKSCPIAQKCAKVDSKFYQVQNKPLKNVQRHVKYSPDGKISPNLVILTVG